MAGYSYSISLRTTHPSRLPEEVTSALGIVPSRSWTVGAPRSTRGGKQLQGVNKESFWTARLRDGAYADDDLEGALAQVLKELAPHRAFLVDFATSGGRSELFIGWFFDEGNSGDLLRHELLLSFAELRLDLHFDVYPEIQTTQLPLDLPSD